MHRLQEQKLDKLQDIRKTKVCNETTVFGALTTSHPPPADGHRSKKPRLAISADSGSPRSQVFSWDPRAYTR
jgi:hypothetical protein